jgi:hypothetical protein
MKLFASVLAGLSLCVSLIGNAEEHPMTTLQGNQIDLKLYDHAFAGSIKDFLVFGYLDEENGISELSMKKDGQVIRATFKQQTQDWFGGVIESKNPAGELVTTKLELIKIDPKTKTITISINGIQVPVAITADAFASGHFQNPTYSAQYPGAPGALAQTVEFKIEKGQACYGFSVNLLVMILGAYFH